MKKFLLSIFIILVLSFPLESSEEIMNKALKTDFIILNDESLDLEILYKTDKYFLESRKVIVTAYNSVPGQTDSTPTIAAWGDKIRPGTVAISRNLETLGITRGTKLYIENYGVVEVLDRMNRRYKDRVDIYFGGRDKVKAAKRFGKRKTKIYWKG